MLYIFLFATLRVNSFLLVQVFFPRSLVAVIIYNEVDAFISRLLTNIGEPEEKHQIVVLITVSYFFSPTL